MESFDKMWSTGEGNRKPHQYSCLENPMNSMKRQKDMTLKMNSPGQKVPNMVMEIRGDSSRRNEEAEPQQKQHPVVEVSGGRSKADVVKNNIA